MPRHERPRVDVPHGTSNNSLLVPFYRQEFPQIRLWQTEQVPLPQTRYRLRADQQPVISVRYTKGRQVPPEQQHALAASLVL